jgi:hypothetical protein
MDAVFSTASELRGADLSFFSCVEKNVLKFFWGKYFFGLICSEVVKITWGVIFYNGADGLFGGKEGLMG